jgi:prepilin-type N-terminal cleavage/methylation domain-containing protein
MNTYDVTDLLTVPCRTSRTAFLMRGFTLIELLVVIAIIGILAGIVLVSLNSATGKGRDAKRLGDLDSLSTALELYADNSAAGTYPSTAGAWWGNCSGWGSHSTSGPSGWIPNLAPQYISVLPLDPKPVGTAGCYLYKSNGTDYMLLAYQTVETYTQSTNPEPRPGDDGPGNICGTNNAYSPTFARYTTGAQCW